MTSAVIWFGSRYQEDQRCCEPFVRLSAALVRIVSSHPVTSTGLAEFQIQIGIHADASHPHRDLCAFVHLIANT